MGNFVCHHSLGFLLGHAAQQAGGYRYKCGILVHAGGEGIDLGESHIATSGILICRLGLTHHGLHQPEFFCRTRISDDLGTDRSGHPFRQGQRNQRTPKAHYGLAKMSSAPRLRPFSLR